MQDIIRVDELARAAGTTTRTVRALQSRGVLSPPRRAGRTAWYTDRHVAELRAVHRLQARGHSVAGIAELLAAQRAGRSLDDVIGLPAGAPATDVPAARAPADPVTERVDGLVPWVGPAPRGRRRLALVPGPIAAALAS